MTPAYPLILPIPKSMELEPADQLVRTNFEGAPWDARNRTRDLGAKVPVTFRFLRSEHKEFVRWFKEDLYNGHRWFLIKLPCAAGYYDHVCRFADRPSGRASGHRYWEVSAQLEVRERILVPPPIKDPLFAKVLILIHCDNGFFDQSNYAHTVQPLEGATINTEIKVFGAGSGQFTTNSNSRIEIPNVTVPLDALTVEYRVRFTNVNLSGRNVMAAGNASSAWIWMRQHTPGTIGFYITGHEQYEVFNVVADRWYAVRIVHAELRKQVMIDGKLIMEPTADSPPSMNGVTKWSFGSANMVSGGGNGGNCYFDEIRVTAASRGLGDYTVDTVPFPNS